ncbi:hypothetical protein ACFX13_004467 [Malus domestica]
MCGGPGHHPPRWVGGKLASKVVSAAMDAGEHSTFGGATCAPRAAPRVREKTPSKVGSFVEKLGKVPPSCFYVQHWFASVSRGGGVAIIVYVVCVSVRASDRREECRDERERKAKRRESCIRLSIVSFMNMTYLCLNNTVEKVRLAFKRPRQRPKGLDQNGPVLKQAKLLWYPFRFQIGRTGEKIVGVVLSLYVWDLGIPSASFDGIEEVLLQTRVRPADREEERGKEGEILQTDRGAAKQAAVWAALREGERERYAEFNFGGSDMEEKLQELMILPT